MKTNDLLIKNKTLLDTFFESKAKELNSTLTIEERQLYEEEINAKMLQAIHYNFASKTNNKSITISIFTSLSNDNKTIDNGLCSCASFTTEYLEDNNTEEDNKSTELFEFITNSCDGTLFDNQDLDKEYTQDDIFNMLNN